MDRHGLLAGVTVSEHKNIDLISHAALSHAPRRQPQQNRGSSVAFTTPEREQIRLDSDLVNRTDNLADLAGRCFDSGYGVLV
jgi:hypothetical protein